MALYKRVNGKKVKMSAKEEKALRAEWAKEDVKETALREAAAQKRVLRGQAIIKLMELGLTAAEVEALLDG